MPQIEVTFDIDANGIVNVSAKDLGTGNAQHITITSSSNMSKEDIEKAVKEAEQYAAEDAKIKEKVEVRNQADQMVYQAEKTLSEVGDKVPESEKAPIQAGIDKLKETLKGEDTDAIKAATEELTQAFYKMSEKLYQQQAPQGDAAAQRPAAQLDHRKGAGLPVPSCGVWNQMISGRLSGRRIFPEKGETPVWQKNETITRSLA